MTALDLKNLTPKYPTMRECARKGKKDGKEAMPAADWQNPAPFVERLAKTAAARNEEIGKRLRQALNRSASRIAELLKIEPIYAERVAIIKRRRDAAEQRVNSARAVIGARSKGLLTSFQNQQDDSVSDPTGLRDFGLEGLEISLFTAEEAQEISARSRQRANLAASAAALDPYWQPLSTAQSIEEGGNQVGLEELRARKSANGRDGGTWVFEKYNNYWNSRDIPLIRQTINEYCRQAATRMGIDF
jgi:hypothetical protein